MLEGLTKSTYGKRRFDCCMPATNKKSTFCYACFTPISMTSRYGGHALLGARTILYRNITNQLDIKLYFFEFGSDYGYVLYEAAINSAPNLHCGLPKHTRGDQSR